MNNTSTSSFPVGHGGDGKSAHFIFANLNPARTDPPPSPIWGDTLSAPRGRVLRLRPARARQGRFALAADRAAQANAGQGRPRCRLAVAFNDHYEGDGEIVFKHACKLRCDGFVSKLGFALSLRPIKALAKGIKNPDAPAMRRKAEEDWGR